MSPNDTINCDYKKDKAANATAIKVVNNTISPIAMITPLVALKEGNEQPMAIPRIVINVDTLKSDLVIFFTKTLEKQSKNNAHPALPQVIGFKSCK